MSTSACTCANNWGFYTEICTHVSYFCTCAQRISSSPAFCRETGAIDEAREGRDSLQVLVREFGRLLDCGVREDLNAVCSFIFIDFAQPGF